MPITEYSDLTELEGLYEGQIANTEPSVVRSGINAEEGILFFGRAVVKGTADDDLLLPVDGDSIILGVAVATDTFEKRDGYSLSSGLMGYPENYPASYLIRGVIGVKVNVVVTPASPVFVVHTAFADNAVGTFRADAGTAQAVQLTSARYLKSGAAGAVVPLSINLF